MAEKLIDLDELRGHLERIGFETSVEAHILHVLVEGHYVASVSKWGSTVLSPAFERMEERDQKQLEYLIDKARGGLTYDAIMEWWPESSENDA